MSYKEIKGKRIWFITDTHLGVKNNSNEWIEAMREYFFDWFFPLVRENYKEGDLLFHLGDFFDSRQSLNLKVLNLGIEIAEEMSSIFKDGVYIIVGNHDIWGKTTNEVNSLKSIKWIPGINVYEDPITLVTPERRILMMPWRKDEQEDVAFLEAAEPHDILCCHLGISGFRVNKYVSSDHGSEVSKFGKFKRVYSGHIHYSQKSNNINMLGSPYELTRSDMDNPKGITLLNLSDLSEEIFPNDFSPKYKRFYFSDLLEKSLDELEPLFKNNYVDILIDPVMSLRANLSLFTDLVTFQRTLTFHPYDPNQATSLSQQIMDVDGKQFNVMDFIKEYINNLEDAQDTEERALRSLSKLYVIVSKQEQDQKIS